MSLGQWPCPSAVRAPETVMVAGVPFVACGKSGSLRVLHMLSEKFGPEPPAPTQNQAGIKSEASVSE